MNRHDTSHLDHQPLFQSMTQGVVYQDASGYFLSANPAAENMLGTPLEQLRGHIPEDFGRQVMREDGSKFSWDALPYAVALKTGKPVRGAVLGIAPPEDGDFVWLRVDAIPEFEQGKDTPSRVVSIFEDISDRRKAQEQFEKFFNLSPDMMGIASPDGTFQRVNPAFEKALGFTASEIRELGWANLVHPDDVESTRLEMERSLRTKSTLGFVNRYRSKDGSYRSVEWRAAVTKEGDIHGIGRDITDRLQTERELQEAAVYLDAMGDALLVLDPKWRVVKVNNAAVKLWGYRLKDEMQRKTLQDLFPKRTLGEHKEALQKVSTTDTQAAFETLVLRKDGSEIPVMLSGVAIKDANRNVLAVVGVFRDITERKRLEQSLADITENERNRLWRDLHDGVCQQLTGLRLIAASLGPQLPTREPDIAERLRQIQEIADGALSMTRQVASGLESLADTPEALVEALRSLASRVSNIYGISCRLTSRKQVLIEDADAADQLFLIAQEAVMNAVKHAQPGRIGILLTEQGDTVKLAVSDNGGGIPRKRSTSGMGMRIMQSRSTLIGASVAVHPGKQAGTVVTCTWKRPATRKRR
jgi:two-component system, LuxR family, sensor kinase FixL